MKTFYKKIIFSVALVGALTTSCSDEEFIDANRNPDILASVSPQNQFLNATINIHSQDFEAYYDIYRRIMPWMQYVTPQNGNAANFTKNIDNFSNRYSRLYTGVGDALVDLEQLVNKLPEADRAQYTYMVQIAHILKAYYAFYVSDIYGSIPYSDAWQGRYEGTLLPTYEDQPALFAHLDTDIKTALTTLKTAQSVPQLSLENFDQYYNGDVARWIKAGNALRLKIAMRVLKRDQGKAMPIINEVLSESPDFLMSSNTDGWVFKASSGFTSGGNWNPDALYATKPLVDFMWDKQDPRLDVFFSPNGYTTENIKALINEGELPNGTTEPARRYLGSFTSPDESKANVNEKYYEARIATIDGQDVRVDTLSLIQRRLFQPSFNEGKGAGEGAVYFPVISYAEFCFMRAELAARSLTSDDAETFYNTGVTSSIQWYDQAAKDAKLSNYTELKPDEIADYLAMPEVAFDPAKALDQIASQAYLNFFKQPQEGWALWKRTGLPNTTTVLALTDMKSGGASLAIPRRAPLSLVSENDTNFTNKKAAYDAMAQDSGFGAGPSDAFGRVWWDN